MKLKFTKMQGLGNDYIYVDCLKNDVFLENIKEFGSLSKRLSDRHFGVGADGLILILPSDVADGKMRIFNADGSEAPMCGNGIRCVGKLIYERYRKNNINIKNAKELKIETLSGVKNLEILENNLVKVDIGKPSFEIEKIPVIFDKNRVLNENFKVGGRIFKITCVSLGNPHCGVFLDDFENLENFDIEFFGPRFEKHKIFPVGVNTEFVKIIDKNTIEMRVWERGSQETLACGTGGCAAAIAAIVNNYCKNTEITVKLKGGNLLVRYDNNTVCMTGEVKKVFDGEVEI